MLYASPGRGVLRPAENIAPYKMSMPTIMNTVANMKAAYWAFSLILRLKKYTTMYIMPGMIRLTITPVQKIKEEAPETSIVAELVKVSPP